ncbi:MAG: EVE domain-containing protein [Gemmatimonadota bacterium]
MARARAKKASKTRSAPEKSGGTASAKRRPKGTAKESAKESAKERAKKGAPVPAPLAPRFHRYRLPRTDDGVRYWLLKTEPEVFSFADLERAPHQTACWDGVRNFQARNFLRDQMRVGDLTFIYHSNAEPTAIVGIARVVRAAYPDHTAFDPADAHFDPKSDPTNPTWVMVDVQAVRALRPLSLGELRETPGLDAMELVQRGSRLSITPVTAEEWAVITRLGDSSAGS